MAIGKPATRRGEGPNRCGQARRGDLAGGRGRGVDLIVMGTHGRTGPRHVLLGSIAETMVHTAPCPVFTVKAPAHVAS